MMAERKKEKEALKAARDEKLQSIGIDASDEYFMEKLAEVKEIADSIEQFVVKEATEMLEKIPEASEADDSVAAPESASVAEVSEASVKVIQTSSLPFIIPTHISPSTNNLNKQPLIYPFRLNSLQQLLNALRIPKTLLFLTYPNVIHPQICLGGPQTD